MELRNYLHIVIRKLWIILPILLVTLAATVIYTRRQQPVYGARATFVARLNEAFIDNKSDASALDILSRRTEIATTFSEVAKSRRIKFYAGEKLGLPPEARGNITVDSRLISGTNIMEITAEGSDPVVVRDFTNAVGDVTIEYVNGLYEAYELVPLDEAIAPIAPTRPNKLFNYLIGAIVGLALGLAFAFLSEALSTIKQSEDGRQSGEEMEDFERGYATSQWQHELVELRSQLEETQMMMRRTQQNAEAANTTVRSFVDWLDKYRMEVDQLGNSSNGTTD